MSITSSPPNRSFFSAASPTPAASHPSVEPSTNAPKPAVAASVPSKPSPPPIPNAAAGVVPGGFTHPMPQSKLISPPAPPAGSTPVTPLASHTTTQE